MASPAIRDGAPVFRGVSPRGRPRAWGLGPRPRAGLGPDPRGEGPQARLPRPQDLFEILVVVLGAIRREFEQVDPIEEQDEVAEAPLAEELRDPLIGGEFLG